MADMRQKLYIVIFVLCLHTAISKPSKEDLDGAEANGKLEIIKQIKKVNDDGTYTIGYEADDGSFKIESRDVLGNVKGTYGYVDENGEIKRVSYSTNNSSEVITKPESSSVVQRIPKTRSSSSRSANFPTSTTPTTLTTQTTPRRRTTTTTTPPTTTTNYSEFIKAAVKASKSATAYPDRLLQPRPIVRTIQDGQKSEGQLIRPDVSVRPTDIPIYRRPSKTLESESKPVTEESETRINLLRRQLNEKNSYDPRQHLLNLQQSSGSDVVDVYSASVTTGAPRPLFTTSRPKFLSTTTIPRPMARYPNYQKDEATTEGMQSTPNPVPVLQIPANQVPHETLVAIPHPSHGSVIVPLSQLRSRFTQINNEGEQYPNEQFLKETQTYQPIYVRRYMPTKALRVQVDENGYIREMPNYSTSTPYTTPTPNYINNDEEVNLIKPPVSTKDFQKLLQQLIFRQSRLEQISRLMQARRYEFGERYQPVYQSAPIYARRPEERPNVRYVNQLIPDNQDPRQYQNQLFTPTSESFTPTRRVARLLKPRQEDDDDEDETDYLPPDVREMLLLKMLQLAINPGLPLDELDNFEAGTMTTPRHKKTAVRNVEILGEEDDTTKRKR